ncbi:MAG: phenylacetate--CoA ligase family protein [Acetatifactor sp.]|nr:phenylacetate--CoA ligase family protein [Acetatifactor sp.]
MNYFRLLWNLYQLKQNTKKSRQQIELLQKKKLEKILKFAYKHSPYYRKVFETAGIKAEAITQTPLSEFPTLNKEQLIEHFDDLVTNRSLNQEELLRFDEHSADGAETYLGKYHVVHSSGSTGTPRYFVYDNAAWEQMLLGIIRGALWGMSMPEILKLLAEKPRILYIAATDGRYGGAMAVGDGVRGVRAEQKFLDINTPLTKWIDAIQDFRPNMLIGYPSAIKILAELMEAEGTTLRIKRIISCGEPLSPGLRKYLESTFKTTVMNFYGASESLALGVEQQADEGMFLFDDLNIVEVIDGEMYLTCLYNFTQPLIRYHISDHLVLRESERDATCSFSRADVLLCRNEDVLWFETKNGRMEYLHPLSIEGLCIEGLLDYQFCQTSKNSFEMIAEITSPSVGEKVSKEIKRQMQTLLFKNGLADVQFSIRFARQIMPDTNTGKKLLIVS